MWSIFLFKPCNIVDIENRGIDRIGFYTALKENIIFWKFSANMTNFLIGFAQKLMILRTLFSRVIVWNPSNLC